MSEHQMETRRRSRSKTPFLRSNCDHETCEHAGEEGHSHQHKKKTAAVLPNVQTIVEETVEVTSSSSPLSKQSQQKIKTSDYSSEDNSPEYNLKSRALQASHQKQSSSFSTTTTSSTIVTKSKKMSNLGAFTSTPKGGNYAVESFSAQFAGAADTDGAGRRLKEIAQNRINAEFERSQQQQQTAINTSNGNSHNNSSSSRSQKNSSFSRIFGNSFGSATNGEQQNFSGDVNEHLAYKEYVRAGEYWKTTPKTDYTYSELSPHRRLLAPGVVAMPNMSRRSLENHHDRINYMVERDPGQESYIRRRYESSKYAQNRRETNKLIYDSGDELDKSHHYYNTYKMSQEESWFMRIITTVVTTFTSFWSSVSGGGSSAVDESVYYNTKITNEERGFFGSITHGISSFFGGIFRSIYLFISSVLRFDTWLLQSAHAENKGRKRFLLFLLILLPLLLLAAWLLLDDEERLAYLQRSQALLPVSLIASVRHSLASTGATFKGLLQLPALQGFTSSHLAADDGGAQIHIQNIQKTLTPEEYENILNHVNSYVQQLVDTKVKQEQQKATMELTPKMALVIANVVRENLEIVMREKRDAAATEAKRKPFALSDDEIQHIANLVQVKLEAASLELGQKVAAVQLTQDHLAQITKLINERLEINNHHFYTTLEHVDLEALLARILVSPHLAQFVDARIHAIVDGKLVEIERERESSGEGQRLILDLDKQQVLINELNKEIAFIKLALSDKLSENQDLHLSISNLKLSQDDLLKRVQEHELSTDKRFSGLLAEIESKLAALKDEQFTLLNQQIKLSLVEILGFKQTSGGKLQDIDLQNWVRNMFVAKEFLEQRLLEINSLTDNKIKEEIDRSGVLLMRDISERLKREILLAVEAKQNESNAAIRGQISSALSEAEVKQIVKNVLAIYDADKTGLVDFALESAGGQILSTRCTESYQTKTAQLSVFGIPLWYPTNTPRVAISPNVQPGECWAFQGFPGFLVLKLNSLVYVTGFTLEHIPKSLAPNGRIDSAPKNFTVWGLEHEKDQEPVLFGEYEYVDNDASLQFFPLQNKAIKRPYEIVELRIESNHGHPQYTCLYRFRVHGKPPAA